LTLVELEVEVMNIFERQMKGGGMRLLLAALGLASPRPNSHALLYVLIYGASPN